MKMNEVKIDDSVKVKSGILCPDLEDLCIGGWQGRISEITEADDGTAIVRIEWDSITLKNMPDCYIDQSEEEDLDCSAMYLEPDDVELTESRDKKEDAAETLKAIFKAYRWGWLGEEGKRIQNVLFHVNENDEMEAIDAWEKYLEKTLSYPFDAIITEGSSGGHLKQGDKLSVKRISLVEDFHGIIVELRLKRNKYDHPLCNMEVINRKSSNYQLVSDYCTWFWNR
ncbi:MAG: calcium-binding protein [Methanosarcinales archaeon]|nr:calcium-binding protein [Methanosarcinales archaeon]